MRGKRAWSVVNPFPPLGSEGLGFGYIGGGHEGIDTLSRWPWLPGIGTVTE